MPILTIDLPAMYADHHVTEVRHLLLAMSGVEDVYASSCFQSAEIHYDSNIIDPAAIESQLEQAGYTEALEIPIEASVATYGDNGSINVLRHSAAYEKVETTVSFAHQPGFSGRPLWPCPGFGLIRNMDEDNNG